MRLETDYMLSAICYGEILWDILPDGPQPGGAPLNVAYHLNRLGINTGVISRIGKDAEGEKLKHFLDAWGIKGHYLQEDGDYETSKVIAKISDSNNVTYEIVAPVAWDFIDGKLIDKKILNTESYFIYGSLSSRNEVSRNTLLDLLESPAIKVFDVNARFPFVDKEVMRLLLNKADVVKFNEAELELIRDFFGKTYESEVEQVAFVSNYFNIPEIIVTKGELGATYYKEGAFYHSVGRSINLVDTIGSGDAFLAAFIAGHYYKKSPTSILSNATKMGSFVATYKGGCPDYEKHDYTNFMNQK